MSDTNHWALLPNTNNLHSVLIQATNKIIIILCEHVSYKKKKSNAIYISRQLTQVSVNLKGISLKGNKIPWLEYELVYYNVAANETWGFLNRQKERQVTTEIWVESVICLCLPPGDLTQGHVYCGGFREGRGQERTETSSLVDFIQGHIYSGGFREVRHRKRTETRSLLERSGTNLDSFPAELDTRSYL